MRSALVACVLFLTLGGASYAQQASPTPGGPAGGRPELTQVQRDQIRAARDACAADIRGQKLERAERRRAMRSCMEAKNPDLKPIFARGEARRAEMRQVRDSCRSEVRGKNLRGDARRDAMRSCVVAKKPEMAKAFNCMDEARAKGLQPGPQRRDFMRSCIRA